MKMDNEVTGSKGVGGINLAQDGVHSWAFTKTGCISYFYER